MKRFWTAAGVDRLDGGFGLRLDTRPVRTPGRLPLVVPTRALAEAIAAEWDAQTDEVRPAAMPLTRAANTAIERVAPCHAEVVAAVAAYGETDLVCYRAPGPAGLVAEQAAAWDPVLDWAAARFGARLVLAEGVMHVAQPADALAALHACVAGFDAWELTALHELVTLSGSLVLGLAAAHGEIEAGDAWRRARIDEDWNIREWGEDAEAARVAALRRADFDAAMRLLDLVRSEGRASPS